MGADGKPGEVVVHKIIIIIVIWSWAVLQQLK